MKKTAYILIVLMFLPCFVRAESRDTRIISAVLTDFASRKDTRPYHSDGVILIDRDTMVRTEEYLQSDEINGSNSACVIPVDLLAQFASRNLKKVPSASLVVHSSKWRLLKSKAELESEGFGFDRTPSGQKIRTVVTLSHPALSSTGDTAFVLLSFAWSKHGALAKYLLKNSQGKWNIQCSELQFFF